MMFKCLYGQCPEYLSYAFTRVSDISTRQSRHGNITLRCPKYLCKTEGGRTFEVAALKEWNKLPISIRASQSVKVFKKNYAIFLRESYAGLEHFNILFQYYFYGYFITCISTMGEGRLGE